MIDLNLIRTEDYYYHLPQKNIAFTPAENREKSRLLIMNEGEISESIFQNIDEYLPADSKLFCNNTKVIHARLLFNKDTGAKIEIFCLEPVMPSSDVAITLATRNCCEWKCMVGNAKKWKNGKINLAVTIPDKSSNLIAEQIKKDNEIYVIRFTWDNAELTFSEILENAGQIPLPPYIKRKAEENDKNRYQTVFSLHEGSVAAPTAGLHFTENILRKLTAKGIEKISLTLHVGAGTFKPLTSVSPAEHIMHSEHFIFTKDLLQKLDTGNSFKTVVGTTTLRALESIYWCGVNLILKNCHEDSFIINQWLPYLTDSKNADKISLQQSVEALINFMNHKKVDSLSGETKLMILPGYKIRTADAIITNFHQPESTLLLLVAAITGNNWKKAYNYALDKDFRFLSYGDACLFFNKK